MRLFDEVGISGTAHPWFCSYLRNTTQQVTVNQSFSEDRPLSCGVPQGSVLGPILFSLYTTQLGRIIEKRNVCRKLFADDTELYHAFHPDPTSALTAVRIVEECRRDVKPWITANKPKLNDGKTKAFICGSKSSQLKVSLDSIPIGQSVIPLSDTVRDRWFFLDKNLSMTNHVSSAVRLCFIHLRCLGKLP